MYASEITDIIKPIVNKVVAPQMEITRLLTDSRSLTDAEQSLFFAIPSKRNTGCRYVSDLYDKGVRNFVIADDTDEGQIAQFQFLNGANFWYVKDVVRSLQLLAAWKREQFDIPVVGITGSNGKTIVKDWLVQLVSPDYNEVSSPKSYNSQIGVPLSVWQMNSNHNLAIFEAGISETGEMDNLRNVIQPTIGIFTNIGQAHDENFLTRYQKIAEKLLLFTRCEVVIYCADHRDIHSVVSEKESFRNLKRFVWGSTDECQVRLLETVDNERSSTLRIAYKEQNCEITIPFIDGASIENAMHCITFMIYMGYDMDTIAERCARLLPVAMRMEMDEGINNCLLINDSYSLDVNSLTIALDYIQHDRQHFVKTLIMSDFFQTGIAEQELYYQVANLIRQRGISKFIGIGEGLMRNKDQFEDIEAAFYPSTEDFIRQYPFSNFQSETILLKGARVFRFENIAKVLQRKTHETIMEVNLDALVRNLNFYRSRIKPSTKLMAMVKAASYGAGKVEIANALQYNHVDYLTVAYTDEGIDLRRSGITLPIMVMNPEEDSFDNIIRYHLEPDIYSFRILRAFSETTRLFRQGEEKVPVHIELDTGMHRLGFGEKDLGKLIDMLKSEDCPLEVRSIFSHLACSEDPKMDDFTRQQIGSFTQWSNVLKDGLQNSGICCHILNSSGITRFPEAQMDMVRLGIGLYGISPEPDIQNQLTLVSHIKTRISQLKDIPQSDSVGYNRKWIAKHDSRIAIIPIGYADGLNRRLGCGRGRVTIHGKEAPIIGSICMDMCFVDVTDIDCKEGDEVIIFGDIRLMRLMSEAADTIPYELLTSISPRVKRVYYQE
ncbi:MAG: bifunctional UDP-N-acetylmuramoyl-tripeptide:D-alanyl-D-alanine ligase/alanine racemase [Bacteroidales bacterium]|jgi:alanine racemase|nr:bifunctional UDP-N-acetylmuramoyl-tripeptide:D-alanyl-D-alanine ligase/alanine racemase [Bacteroidales bacterium]